MDLSSYQAMMLPAIDVEIRSVMDSAILDQFMDLREILYYHLGYEEHKPIESAQGKRIRPLLVLLTAEAAGGKWENALPAAAAVELLHNFSLIHDDIEDHSRTRRGRPTVWAKWGEPLAINAGDAMYALAFSALDRLILTAGKSAALEAYRIMTDTCIRLTGGQHLDISFENVQSLPLEAYWSMVSGKTSSLISACVRLGGIIAGPDEKTIEELHTFGHSLGLSFQIQDDCLGIWGVAAETGKSNANDLVTGKKTLPILYGIQQNKGFAAEWNKGQVSEANYQHLADLLVADGAKAFSESQAARLTNEAMKALKRAGFDNEAGEALQKLAESLLNRRT